jgi:hypothetical protein
VTTAPILAVKAALLSALTTLYGTAVQVTYGMPGPELSSFDLVVIGDANVSVERPTMGTARSREHVIQQQIIFSCWRPGGPTQQSATEASVAYMEQLSDYLRTSPNERLSGACRDSFISTYIVTETSDPDEAEQGRRCDVDCTVLIYVRN